MQQMILLYRRLAVLGSDWLVFGLAIAYQQLIAGALLPKISFQYKPHPRLNSKKFLNLHFKPKMPFLRKIKKIITKVNFHGITLDITYAIFLKMAFPIMVIFVSNLLSKMAILAQKWMFGSFSEFSLAHSN